MYPSSASPPASPANVAAAELALGGPILNQDQAINLQQLVIALGKLVSTGGGGGGSGTVTSFSAIGDSGVEVVVTNPTTTPELTIGLGNITPTRVTIDTAGSASVSELSLTGTWFTGGSSTTTKPKMLIEEGGATSNNWNTSGTGFGINAATGFGGNLLDLQVNGVRKFNVTAAGNMQLSNSATLWPMLSSGSGQNIGIQGGAFTGLSIRADNGWACLGYTLAFLEDPGNVASVGASLSMPNLGTIALASGNALRLGNAAVASGALVSTHSLTIQDSTGTTYRIPVLV